MHLKGDSIHPSYKWVPFPLLLVSFCFDTNATVWHILCSMLCIVLVFVPTIQNASKCMGVEFWIKWVVSICSIYNCRGFVCSFCCFVQTCKFSARPISITTIIKIGMMIFLLISLQDFIKDKWFPWILRSLSLQYMCIKSFQVSKKSAKCSCQ